jgi:hypothetical protein
MHDQLQWRKLHAFLRSGRQLHEELQRRRLHGLISKTRASGVAASLRRTFAISGGCERGAS